MGFLFYFHTMSNTTTTPVQVSDPLKEKSWVMTPKGVGLFIAYTNVKPPLVPRCSVQFKTAELFDMHEVYPATFLQFCFRSSGFGQTPWLFVVLLAVALFFLWKAGAWWMTPVGVTAMLVGTYMNFKRWWV